MLELTLLNHPVDCGICDKAGECTLQDYHYQYNGAPSQSRDAKVRATKFHALERAHRARQRALHPLLALRALHARDIEVERARDQFARRHVAGARAPKTIRSTAIPTRTTSSTSVRWAHSAVALVSLQVSRLVPRSRRPRSARAAHAAAPCRSGIASPSGSSMRSTRARTCGIERVTPLENPAVNGPWICNKGRDLAQIFERPRAEQAMQNGRAGRSGRSDRRGPPPDRRSEAPRCAWCRAGARTRKSRRSAKCWARRFTTFFKSDRHADAG